MGCKQWIGCQWCMGWLLSATSTAVKEDKLKEERSKEETRTLIREPNNQYNIGDMVMPRDVTTSEIGKVEVFDNED